MKIFIKFNLELHRTLKIICALTTRKIYFKLNLYVTSFSVRHKI